MMNSKYFMIVCAATAIFAGCTNVAKFDYNAAQGTMLTLQTKGTATKTISVVPFIDQRAAKHYDAAQANISYSYQEGDRGSFYLGFLPLYPSGFVGKEEPENSVDFVTLGRFHFDVQNDLAKAASVSLKASKMFADVKIANTLEQANTDYIWRGRVTNTYYTGSMLSYGITYFFSCGLWVIGFPSGISENELWVKFELIERKSGNVLWTYDYYGRDYITHWLYARTGKDASLYAELMKKAMNGALYDLNRKIPVL